MLHHQPPLQQRFQPQQTLLLAASRRGLHRLQIERAPDDRARGKHLGGHPVQTRQAGGEKLAHAGRGQADFCVRVPAFPQCGQLLDQQKRDALALRVQPLGQRGIPGIDWTNRGTSRQAALDSRNQTRHILHPQAFEGE